MKKRIIFGMSMLSVILISCGGGEDTAEKTSEENEVTEEVVEAPVNYIIDTENSIINWMAYEANKEDGIHQSGTVKVLNGEVTIEGDAISGASMDVDMNTILTDGGSEKLDGHLKGEDFFDVNNYASTTFAFDRHEDGIIYGSVTVLGMEIGVEAPAEVMIEEGGLTVNISEFELNLADLPYFIADKEQPAEEQHNPNVGFTATIVGTK